MQTLQRFNRKVEHLEASGFSRRFADASPNLLVVMHKMEGVEVEPGGLIHITAKMSAVLEEFDQDEIDAFVLTLRLFTQRNDSISLASLASIYAAAWMPEEAGLRFTEALAAVEEHLASEATVMLEDSRVTVGQLVEVVIYGGMAHTNARKAETFERWTDSGVGGFLWAEFYAHAKRMLEFLVYFRSLNEAVLEFARVSGTPQAV